MTEPQPGEYWQHKMHTTDRVYFIGRTPDGEMVWQCEGDTIEAGNLDWSQWQHLPECTGWDWQPQASSQVGAGYELLPAGTRIKPHDEYLALDGIWRETNFPGYHIGTCYAQSKYRRKKTEQPEALIDKPKATRTVTLHQWIVWDEVGGECELWRTQKPISWKHYISTGETKTIEVPL